mgnify:CR=1 FL=1
MNLLQKAKGAVTNKCAILAAAMATPMLAFADGGADIGSIGTAAATEIAKFAVMITAIGTAVLSVVVLIQGFRLAAGMTKTAR